MKHGRTFSDFLSKLMVVESGIDPACFDWYRANYRNPVLRYPRVSAPGRVERLADGSWRTDIVTVEEYFSRLGVAHLFDPRSADSLRAMQYASTNFLGFVGYQIGEAILLTTGYYAPERVTLEDERGTREYERYYYGLLEIASWQQGRTEIEHVFADDRAILATDVNRWQGSFTGKAGIRALTDLKKPELQDRVLRDIVESNIGQILANLQLSSPAEIPQPAICGVRASLSSMVAAAHLCGADAVSDFLRSGQDLTDETGTSLTKYMVDFAGFATPFA